MNWRVSLISLHLDVDRCRQEIYWVQCPSMTVSPQVCLPTRKNTNIGVYSKKAIVIGFPVLSRPHSYILHEHVWHRSEPQFVLPLQQRFSWKLPWWSFEWTYFNVSTGIVHVSISLAGFKLKHALICIN